MATEARQRLTARQAELVRALVARGPVPTRFDARRIAVAARTLVSKRRQTVARVWPSIVKVLGDAYVERFTAYAEAHPLSMSGSPRADGRAFIGWLESHGMSKDELRVEALAFDFRYVETPSGLRLRRGLLVKMVKLQESRSRVIAVRVPWLGERWWGMPRLK